MDIKFDSLASLDAKSFAKAGPTDYPNGRYSGTITAVKPVTADKDNKFCFRYSISTAIDKHEGKPNLFVNDQVTFTVRSKDDTYSISWAAVNSFCDLSALAGSDRDSVYALFKQFARACESGNKTAMRDTMLSINEVAKTLVGERVAPNVTWSDDGQYANVRGSKASPSYLSARNEVDPAATMEGDDIDAVRPAKRTLTRSSRNR